MKKINILLLTLISIGVYGGSRGATVLAETVEIEPKINIDYVLDYYFQDNKQLISTGGVTLGKPYGHTYKELRYQNSYSSTKKTRVISETISGLYRVSKIQTYYVYVVK